MCKRCILVCDRGWQRIREKSIELAKINIPSTVLIRGVVDRDVREMITPCREIRNVFFPAKIFTMLAFTYVFLSSLAFCRGSLCVFLSKKRTYDRLLLLRKIFYGVEYIKLYES